MFERALRVVYAVRACSLAVLLRFWAHDPRKYFLRAAIERKAPRGAPMASSRACISYRPHEGSASRTHYDCNL
jgi:hypothetical protein